MSINNKEVEDVIKEKFNDLEESINYLEKEFFKEDFDKSRACFQFGRMQQIYLSLTFFAKKNGII